MIAPGPLPSTPAAASSDHILAGVLRSGMRIAAVTLGVVFLAEVVVMLLLPHIVPGATTSLVEALVDAVGLTALLMPLVLSLETRRRGAEEARERLVVELRESLSKVKTLSGLLPICAHCKKIRNDKGYWIQIESYIRSHSEAEFSHGLCPACLQQYYPDFADAAP